MDEWQGIINWIMLGVSIVASVIGWFVRVLWDAVKELKSDLKSIEVNLPVEYVRHAHFDRIVERFDSDRHREHTEIMAKLDGLDGKFNRVYDKLENKVDK